MRADIDVCYCLGDYLEEEFIEEVCVPHFCVQQEDLRDIGRRMNCFGSKNAVSPSRGVGNPRIYPDVNVLPNIHILESIIHNGDDTL